MLKQVIITAMLMCIVPNSVAGSLPVPSNGPSPAPPTTPLEIIHCQPIAVVMWKGVPKTGLFCVAEPPEGAVAPSIHMQTSSGRR